MCVVILNCMELAIGVEFNNTQGDLLYKVMTISSTLDGTRQLWQVDWG